MRLKLKFLMNNGGATPFSAQGSIIIHRVHIMQAHDWARQNSPLRDYLLFRTPMKIGLRTQEICTLRVEGIDFESRMFYVRDSKNKHLYPLPLDPVTLSLIKDLVGERQEGYVFTREVYSRSWSHKKRGKPLHVTTVEAVIEKIGEAVGIKHLTPRLLRAYFAANWHIVEKKSLEVLRQILRHKSLQYTQFYVSRLVFFEDIQAEYQSVKDGPFVSSKPVQASVTEPAVPKVCRDCDSLSVCKFVEKMPWWASGCSFKKQKEELIKK